MKPEPTAVDFRSWPKIDLHLHLDGAIRVATIAELGEQLGVPLPAREPEQLARFVQVDRDCRSLADFLKRFEVFYPILPYAVTQERIAYELCEDCAQDGVIYFETRFAPALAASERFSMEAAVEAALEGLRRGQRDFGVTAGLILCCYRSATLRENLETVRLAAKYRPAGVVGIDLAGDERNFPASACAEAFALARRLELPITIHAGEAGPAQNIREAVFEYGATRIGHGVALTQDGELLRQVRDRGTVLEMCLTSNLQTCSVPSLAAHPFRQCLAEQLRVTLNTDDPAISNIRLSDEFALAQRVLGLTADEARRLLVTAAEGAFAEPSVRRQLVARLQA
jgi:adenosine deaminase